jgi:hypothetical protein
MSVRTRFLLAVLALVAGAVALVIVLSLASDVLG